MRHVRPLRFGVLLAVLGIGGSWLVLAQDETRSGEWRSSGGDSTYKRYSALSQINRDNVKNVRIAWRHPALDPKLKEQFPNLRTSNYLLSTPTMIGGVLYAPDAAGLIQAFDATTGEMIWRQEPTPDMASEVNASSTRGVDFWKGSSDYRLFTVRKGYLYAVDLRGKTVGAFASGGRLNLLPTAAHAFSWSSGPIVVGDVIVVAGNLDGAGDSGFKWKNSPPEDVRGFDARSGKLLWTFHVVPREGEFGVDSWGNGSWKLSGDLGSWCCISADEELGYVYIPLTAPTAAYYGGFRPGDNLFSNALVALDVKTGKRVWHFQMVHHDLWEYDTVGPPTLGEITVDGKRIKAVMQPSKTGFLYVFDRVTGKPVWPIEERPVPQSTVPGEHTAATQPFPTKPPPFARIGLTEDDLIDFTPELRAKAREIARQFVIGPIFTPPSMVSDEPGGKQGTLMVPGSWGAGNWNTGAFDPETGVYYAFSHEIPRVYRLAKATEAGAEMDYWSPNRDAPYIDGLPIIKPPYGRIVALDLNRGEQLWTAVNGDGPRNHPQLKGLNLPPLGTASRPTALVTKTLLFIGEGSNLFGGVQPNMFGKKFRAYDKATGQVIWEMELPSGTTGGPMTYMARGKQYIVVPIGGKEEPAEWIALSLP
jgi:quinoprotein glucose dehydrogenase